MQLLPAVLLMTQAASPADVFCVQLMGRSVMFCVSLNGRITAKEAADSFTKWDSQSFAQKGTLVMISSCPCTMLKLKAMWLLSEMLGPGGSKWGGGRQGNCMQFPKVCVNRTESAKKARI